MYQYRHLTSKQKEELLKERLNKGFPSHSPPHPIINQPFYLLTAACYEHKQRINSCQRRQQLLNQLLDLFQRKNINTLAWVILANHYHLLTSTIDFKWLSKDELFQLDWAAADIPIVEKLSSSR